MDEHYEGTVTTKTGEIIAITARNMEELSERISGMDIAELFVKKVKALPEG